MLKIINIILLFLCIAIVSDAQVINALKVNQFAIMNDGTTKSFVELGVTSTYHDDSKETYFTINNQNLQNVKSLVVKMTR